jgi:hypothetical protein
VGYIANAHPNLFGFFRPSPLAVSPTSFPALQDAGVGQKKDSKSKVRGTNGGRWYALPFRIVPEGGQVSEYVSHPPNKEPWDVLQERESGS